MYRFNCHTYITKLARNEDNAEIITVILNCSNVLLFLNQKECEMYAKINWWRCCSSYNT